MYEKASVDDLAQIFTDSVIVYDGEPVYVKSVSKDRELSVIPLNKPFTAANIKTVNIEDGKFNFTPVSLGFCNEGGDSFYVTRVPKRQYKQGLVKTSISAQYINEGYSNDGLRKVRGLVCCSMYSCIKGEYPSIETAIKSIDKKGTRSIAFSRNFSIDEEFNLYYKTDKVGMIDVYSGKYSFNKSKMFLKELLDA